MQKLNYFFRFSFLTLLLAAWVGAFAQSDFKITGQVIETDDYAPLQSASVQLLTKDSLFLSGVVSDENGNFSLHVDKRGAYKLRVSSIGYKAMMKDFEVRSRHTQLGTLRLSPDSIMLEGAEVVAALPKVQVVEDTVMYNASAYSVPPGGVLDELIKLLPGAEVTDEGITINGKRIEKILVNGKEFFVGDMSTARKNLPVDVVEKLKVYDEKSELARVTGIDDGNDRPVIDVRLKKGMDIGTMANGDVGYGTHSLYSGRVMASAFTTRNKLSAVANGSNSGSRQGLRTNQEAGLNYNYDDKGTNGRRDPTLQMDGSVRWNHGTQNQDTRQMNENWEKVGARTYSHSHSSNLSKSHGFNANFRMEWRPDTMTNIQFRPSFSLSENNRLASSSSMQFSDNPYAYTDTPLELFHDFIDSDSIRTNHRRGQTISHSENRSVGAWAQFNRKLNSLGRNITLRIEGNYGRQQSEDLSNNFVHLFKVRDRHGNDSVYYTNRYNRTPSSNYNYTAQITYSEPLMRATFLQFSYRFNYSVNENDRKIYDFSALGEQFGADVSPAYGAFGSYLGNVGQGWEDYLDHKKSQYGHYANTNHDAQILFRIIRNHYNFSTGVRWQPQRSHFEQDYLGVKVDTVRTVQNFSPTVNLYIRFTKQHTLKFDYRGNTSQPSISSMLDLYDDTNPLNIRLGNPGLRPSFTNNFSLEWKNYLQATKTNFSLGWRYSNTRNSIGTKVTYNDATGGRTTRSENINGNWNTSGNFNFGTALDHDAHWNVSATTTFNYSNQVSYVNVNRQGDSQLNTTRNTRLGERLRASFHNEWLDVSAYGNVEYSHVRNLLQSTANRDTYNFSYGGSVNIRLPWEMQINTSLSQSSRRGYSNAEANTDELIWNAQISQSLLSRRRLVLSLQVFDILGQQKSFNYNVGDTRLSETHYNSITQYAMLRLVFNFRSFGGKAAHDARRGQAQGSGSRHNAFSSESSERRGPRGGAGGRGR